MGTRRVVSVRMTQKCLCTQQLGYTPIVAKSDRALASGRRAKHFLRRGECIAQCCRVLWRRGEYRNRNQATVRRSCREAVHLRFRRGEKPVGLSSLFRQPFPPHDMLHPRLHPPTRLL